MVDGSLVATTQSAHADSTKGVAVIRPDSAVRISWPGWDFYDGKVGLVIGYNGKIRRPGQDESQLFTVQIPGRDRMAVISEEHLELLRPDLEEYVHSTRFALTGDDVVQDHLGAQRL